MIPDTAKLPATEIPAETLAGPMVQFDASQRRFFQDRARVIAVNWHRQKGKDFTAAAKAVDDALRTGRDWFIVSLTQRQADATFAKCKMFVAAFKRILKLQGEAKYSDSDYVEYDKSLDQHFTCQARQILLPNGARVVSLPGRDPDTLAGLTGNVILTEFGLFPNGGYRHWSVIFPITTRGYQLVAISTPRGKNTKYYEICSDPRTYSVHTCSIYQSVEREGFILKDNNGDPCTMEQFRRLYNDESNWPREYDCMFTGDLQSLIKWAQLEQAAAIAASGTEGEFPHFSFMRVENEAGIDPEFFRAISLSACRGGWLNLGWDVARTGHLSSLWINWRRAGKPDHLLGLALMHKTTFATQRHIVYSVMDSAAGRSVGCGDNTGLGMDSNETLAAKYRDRWEGINFGGTRKKELASGLATAFGDCSQTIPALDSPYKFVATDLYAIQKDDTGGKLLLDETENPLLPESHCDIAWSGALARLAGSKKNLAPLPAPLRMKPIGL